MFRARLSSGVTGMQRLYIYDGALVVIGATLGVPAVRSVTTGVWSLPLLLMTVGGCGLVLAAGSHSVRTDPDEFTVSTRQLALNVGAACLALLGTVLSAV